MVTVIVVVIAVMAALPLGSEVALDPNRVVVAEFRNGTGDSSLDVLGGMAGHWITQGLQQTGVLHVVPWETAFQSSRYIQSEGDADRLVDPVLGLAEETGAGIVISGAYYVDRDSIRVQVDVNDAAAQRLLSSLDPISVSRDSPSDILEPVQQQVMGFLAVRFDERLVAPTQMAGDPPPFEAYRSFSQGLEEYYTGTDFNRRGGRSWFRRAVELDSTWAEPLLYLVFSHLNSGEHSQADSLLTLFADKSDGLTPYYRGYWYHLRALVNRDYEQALTPIRRSAEIAPGSRAWFNYGVTLRRTNRPRQAVAALTSLDPERGAMRGYIAYWAELTDDYSMLGEYESALEVARRARQIIPGQEASVLDLAVVPLAALGRVQELNEVLDELAGGRLSYSLMVAVQVLRWRGHADAAELLLQRALDWFESGVDRGARVWYARALFLDGRLNDARLLVDSLVQHDDPGDVFYRGYRGFIAATQGDTVAAMQDLEWLTNQDARMIEGGSTYWRGVICGARGQHESALELLRQAYDEGYVFGRHIRKYRHELDPLRGYLPFQELMRPKG